MRSKDSVFCQINVITAVASPLLVKVRNTMIDYAVVLVYASLAGIVAVGIGTVVKPLFVGSD